MTREDFIKSFGECPFIMIDQGHAFYDKEILSIPFNNKLSVDEVWEAINNGAVPVSRFICKNWTVAHEMAAKGHVPPESTFSFETKYGWTVAHEIARVFNVLNHCKFLIRKP